MAHTSGNTLIGTSAMLTSLGVAAGSQLGGAGLSIAEVASALVRGTQDLGQLAGDVNASGVRLSPGAINKWAKYKPVRYNNAWDTSGIQNWWKGSNGLCGIDADLQSSTFVFTSFAGGAYPISSFVNRILAAFDSSSAYYDNFLRWDYAPPRGIRTGYDAEPYRLLDFNGYYKDAVSPAGSVRSGIYDAVPIVTSFGSNEYSVLNYGIELVLPSYNLQVTDFGGFSVQGGTQVDFEDCYLGILVVNTTAGQNYGTWAASTMSKTIANLNSGDNHVKIIGVPLNGPDVVSYLKAIPFISTTRMDEDYFPSGVNIANYTTLETEGDPDTGAMLDDGAWLSAFGVDPVNVTLKRFGQNDYALSSDVYTTDGHYVLGELYFGTPYNNPSAVTVGTLQFGLCYWDDVQRYRSGLISRSDLWGLIIEGNHVDYYNVVIPANQRTITFTLTNQGNNVLHFDDELDPTPNYVVVGFASTNNNAIPSVDLLYFDI